MKTPRLFVDQPLQADQTLELDREASNYISRVLRRTEKDPLTLFNGDGNNYAAILTKPGKTTTVQINSQSKNSNESPLNITLVQSLAKGSKLDLIIQKATELGVNRITPVSSDRSVLQIDSARLDKRMQHWRGVAIAACTQCQRSVVPVVDPPQSYSNWLELQPHDNTFILHPKAEQSIASVEINGKHCTMIVGPEGGFNNEEIQQALTGGVIPIACGPRILRTETAGFTSIAILQSRFGDLI